MSASVMHGKAGIFKSSLMLYTDLESAHHFQVSTYHTFMISHILKKNECLFPTTNSLNNVLNFLSL
jgi:hypothetical protein